MSQREIQKLDLCESTLCVARAARFLLIVGFCFSFAGCSLMDTESKTRPLGGKKSISATTKSEKSDKKSAIKKSGAKEDIPTAPIGL